MKKIFFVALCLPLSLLATKVNAYEKFDYIPYIGVDYGFINAKTAQAKNNYNLFNINIGTKYNNHFGTEAFFEQTDSDTKKISNQLKLKTSYRAYGLDAMAYLPIGCYHEFDLFAGIGVAEYVFNKKFGKEKHRHQSGWGYRFGGGFIYNFNEKISLKAAARYVELNDITDINHLYEYTFGLRYHFIKE